MRFLEVRRHSFTKKGPSRGRGSHLSDEGVRAARRVGATLPPVRYVATSESPRAIETAVAMGFAVDDTLPLGAGYATGHVAHHDQWDWAKPFERYHELLETEPVFATAVRAEWALWLSVTAELGEGETALVVTHGGSIEPVLVAAAEAADHGAWGRPFAHLEGATIAVVGDRCVDLTLRRLTDRPG